METLVTILNILGISLLFIGNLLVTDAVTKWSAHKNPKYVWGNKIQGVGFIISLTAILIATMK